MSRALIPLLALALACGGAQDDSAATPIDSGSGDSAEPDWATLSCDEAPVVTWNNFGAGFVGHYCQGCHASTSVDRYGAPESVTFDTVDAVWAFRDRVLARSTGNAPSMPPAGGTNANDRQKLQWWLECAPEGT